MPARTDIQTILVIGSGPIVIGQACEFDYSGCQAIQALKEDGYRVVLINPNPATVMTTPGIADAIYMDPIQINYIEKIIIKEKPDAILATMGGQVALNAAIALSEAGILKKYHIELIGADIESITAAEDRGRFRKKMEEIGLRNPHATLVHKAAEADEFIEKNGLPIIIRPSFTLGGEGGAIVRSAHKLNDAIETALANSPHKSALIEESLIGWGEFEFEVMRDRADNAVIVCAIENIDPMGIHTGDSITIAPTQTLPDDVYQTMRNASIAVLRAVGIACGGANVQFAYNQQTDDLRIIEMNPRVSRSSALASKATGFPIARCAARLAVGYTLPEIENEITKKTSACFEPTLDYCAIKVPRFAIDKFSAFTTKLDSSMKAIGESLALGRTCIEALNKAIRAAEFNVEGLELLDDNIETLKRMIAQFHPLRILAAFTLLYKHGDRFYPYLQQAGGYSPWFIDQIAQYCSFLHNAQKTFGTHPEQYIEAKRYGMSDEQIKKAMSLSSDTLMRIKKQADISVAYHCVDTCGGEFEAQSPYYYATYGEQNEAQPLPGEKVIIVGSGPNRIGQGLEFDTSCTLCSLAYRARGVRSIMINSNPETVSTDHNISDRLYLEPVHPETVVDIMRHEQTKNVVIQLGGQTALNMARYLQQNGAQIVGTAVADIYTAEDRALFSAVAQRLGLSMPKNKTTQTLAEITDIADTIGYPILARPSFVIGGSRMAILSSEDELSDYMRLHNISKNNPIHIDQFLEDAFEYDVDILSDGTGVYIAGIMEHIESAGIHSGDSACVFPAYTFKEEHLENMRSAAVAIARALTIKGFMNIQFAVKNDVVYILEVNPRVSRTIPFISKASGVNLIDIAVDIWMGKSLQQIGMVDASNVGEGSGINAWAIKEAKFSFSRFPNFDPLLGPEMRSTGESVGLGTTFGAAYAKATAAAGVLLPTAGSVAISVLDNDKPNILHIAKRLQQMGFTMLATRGTAQYLFDHGILCQVLLKAHEGNPNMVDYIKSGKLHFIINTPLSSKTQIDDSAIRIAALRHRVPYTTTTSAAEAALAGIEYLRKNVVEITQLVARSASTIKLL